MAIDTNATTTGLLPPKASDDELLQRRPHRWIDRWLPEDQQFWEAVGSRTARRNLVFSILSEHIGFSVWTIWSVLVLFMPQKTYGFSVSDKFLLTTTPAALGSFVRLPYTFAIAKFGGRNWTVISAGLLLIPSVLALVLLKPGVSLNTLLVVTALAGVGGGNFASSMANINNFYPQRLKGRALGLNAGGGNIGVATVQIVGAVIIAVFGAATDPRVLLYIYIPLVLAVTATAWMRMDNLTEATNDSGALREVARHRHTWIISFLYIGTFGSFIGFGFAFGQVLAASGVAHPIYVVWLGAFVGSLIRPVGGALADRFRGSTVTSWNFVAMTAVSGAVLATSHAKSVPLFVTAFTVLFALTGIGNGAVYKMIPAIFHARALTKLNEGADPERENFQARRLASALVGVAGAVGAFGGVLVQIAFRQSFLSTGTGDAAYSAFIAFYALCAVLTWTVYVRSPHDSLIGV
ncbi:MULTISPECIES: NarK/NasA family nitrate transporter [Streptacidiphilus]|uniref:Nitrate/nitrite transporter n=1 Tax=Streptacidiphilus cavernicola TaxID=3342716 RepID=A0ABV6V1M7_9ACTN|nr:nitrate/nitrite transporter [Streptacidiphilus jeojiense]